MEKYFDKNFILYEKIEEDIYKIENDVYFLFHSNIYDKNGFLNISYECYKKINDFKINRIFVFLGDVLNYTEVENLPNYDFKIFYPNKINKINYNYDINLVNLGIRSYLDFGKSIIDFDKLVKRAKFYEHKFLGICEKNLNGVLKFYKTCKENDINPIIGKDVSFFADDGVNIIRLKVYAYLPQGFKNLIKLDYIQNIEKKGKLVFEDILKNSFGLIFCFLPYNNFENMLFYSKKLDKKYFIIEDCIHLRGEKQMLCEKNYNLFLNNQFCMPIFISETLFLDEFEEDSLKKAKKILNNNRDQITNCFFKNNSSNFINKVDKNLLKKSLDNLQDFCNFFVDFEIDDWSSKFPKYIIGEKTKDYFFKEFSKKCTSLKNNEEFFYDVLENYFEKKIKTDKEKYFKVLKKEVEVIKKGDFINYFLIFWDLMMYCKFNNILTGFGRGSASGSLVSFLLEITKIDPVKNNLLFERFLNESRIGEEKKIKLYIINGKEFSGKDFFYKKDFYDKMNSEYILTQVKVEKLKIGDFVSINNEDFFSIIDFRIKEEFRYVTKSGSIDIDNDFPKKHKQKIVDYLRLVYGENNVTLVSTYTAWRIKMLLKDLLSDINLPFKEAQEIIDVISKEDLGSGMGEGEKTGKTITEFYNKIFKHNDLKNIIIKHPKILEYVNILINVPKSISEHASALIIYPNEDKFGNKTSVLDYCPVRMNADGNLVNQWDYQTLDKSGYLKLDILTITQLDKIIDILDLIKNKEKKFNSIYDIPYLENKKCFDYFSNGYNEDVFQFGSKSLIEYCKFVKPENISHLNIINAVYRSATIALDVHKKFGDIKNGLIEPVFNFKTDDILKNTYGLIIFQEQTMRIATELANFDIKESDSLRRALTKKGYSKEATAFKDRFLNGCVGNGCDFEEAKDIWKKLESFSRYGFNEAHSLSYAFLGYVSQYLKVNFPIEFWSVSLSYTGSIEEINDRLSEISKVNKEIIIKSPNINKFNRGFSFDFSKNIIFFGFNNIKYLGIEVLLEIERFFLKNGEVVFSFNEFLNGVEKKKLNKRVVINLILSGAFDEVENIENIIDRKNLIKKIDKENKFLDSDDLILKIEEIKLVGGNYINLNNYKIKELHNLKELSNTKSGDKCYLFGVLEEFKECKTKNGKRYLKLIINSNYRKTLLNIWEDNLNIMKDIKMVKGDFLIITGENYFDSYYKENKIKISEDSIIKIY